MVAKVWSFSFSISPSNEYSGLISFMIDWLDLFAVQGTLKSLHHLGSRAQILSCFLQHAGFFRARDRTCISCIGRQIIYY